MTFSEVLKRFERVATDNSPAILTGVAVIGTVTTAYLTGRASFKAADILREDARSKNFYRKESLDTREKIKHVWKLYIPAVGVGAMTITCVIVSNRIGTRRAAAMAAAFSISEKALNEYKDKVIEKFGEKKEQEIRDDIQQDRMKRGGSELVIIGDGGVLCYDKYTGRYFQSSMEIIKKAQNDTNYEILHNSYCSLGEFYARLGLESTSFSEEVGWNSDHLMEIDITTTMAPDDKPCLCLDFSVEPIRTYNKFG